MNNILCGLHTRGFRDEQQVRDELAYELRRARLASSKRDLIELDNAASRASGIAYALGFDVSELLYILLERCDK